MTYTHEKLCILRCVQREMGKVVHGQCRLICLRHILGMQPSQDGAGHSGGKWYQQGPPSSCMGRYVKETGCLNPTGMSLWQVPNYGGNFQTGLYQSTLILLGVKILCAIGYAFYVWISHDHSMRVVRGLSTK